VRFSTILKQKDILTVKQMDEFVIMLMIVFLVMEVVKEKLRIV